MCHIGSLDFAEIVLPLGGILDAQPIAAPARIGPGPLLAALAVARHQHTHIGNRHIGTAHVHIEADRLAPAADGQLIPAPGSAVADQRQLRVTRGRQRAVETVDQAQLVSRFARCGGQLQIAAKICTQLGIVPVFTQLHRNAGRHAICITQDRAQTGDLRRLAQVQQERHLDRARPCILHFEIKLVIIANICIAAAPAALHFMDLGDIAIVCGIKAHGITASLGGTDLDRHRGLFDGLHLQVTVQTQLLRIADRPNSGNLFFGLPSVRSILHTHAHSHILPLRRHHAVGTIRIEIFFVLQAAALRQTLRLLGMRLQFRRRQRTVPHAHLIKDRRRRAALAVRALSETQGTFADSTAALNVFAALQATIDIKTHACAIVRQRQMIPCIGPKRTLTLRD